jgi:hypothetical protein
VTVLCRTDACVLFDGSFILCVRESLSLSGADQNAAKANPGGWQNGVRAAGAFPKLQSRKEIALSDCREGSLFLLTD